MEKQNYNKKETMRSFPLELAPLVRIYNTLMETEYNPIAIALKSYDELEKEISDDYELMDTLLYEIISLSLHVTFFEAILDNIHNHPRQISELMSNFGTLEEERTNIVETQSTQHYDYIQQKDCSGCSSCDNHADVKDLMPYYHNGDLTFMVNLYVSMQAINFFMEYLLYDVVPTEIDITKSLFQENILNIRKFIVSECELKVKS